MKEGMVRIALEAMAERHGLHGCALVDVEAGMVWHAAGPADELPGLAESVTDFWRLHLRQREHLPQLDELMALVLVHATRQITLVGCGPGLVLMALAARNAAVDWPRWHADTGELQKLAASF